MCGFLAIGFKSDKPHDLFMWGGTEISIGERAVPLPMLHQFTESFSSLPKSFSLEVY